MRNTPQTEPGSRGLKRPSSSRGSTHGAAFALRTWFEQGKKLGEAINQATLEIYGRFLAFFTSARHIAELPAHEEDDEPRELPPAPDEGT